MNSEEVCRVCLNASDELKSLHAILCGKNKTVVEAINFVVNINIELGKGLPNKICSDCESKLAIADVFKQGCLESEAILGQHVNIKKEKGYEELPTVLSEKIQEPAEYTKKTCLSSVADNTSTDLLEIKTEVLPVEYVVKVELDELHDHDGTISESHDHDNYTEELENKTEEYSKTKFTNSEKLISLKKDYDKLIEEVFKYSDKVAFFCALCKENFFERDEYKAHLLSHHDPKNFRDFECGMCGKTFQCQYTFKKHLRTHVPNIKRTSTNMYPCKTCDQMFTVKSNLTKHIQNRNCGQFTGMGCKKIILDQESLDTHEAEHSKRAPRNNPGAIQKVILLEIENPEIKFSTATITNHEEKSEEDMSLNIDKTVRPTCQVKQDNNKGKEHIIGTNQFDSIKNMASTSNVEHYPATTKWNNKVSCTTHEQTKCSSNYEILSCDICEYITSRLQSLNSHLKAHTAATQYPCGSCLFIATDFRSIKMHKKLHTGEKPYFCNVCDKKFSIKFNLDRHVRLHTGIRPYSCNECGKKFFQKGHLVEHVKVHTGEKPYSCNVCEKKFCNKSSLDKHVRIHTGEKPYSCNLCDKKFSQKGNLDIHVRLHTGEKPYCCHVCDKKFSVRSSLLKHVKLHTGENLHSCNICDKKFLSKSNLGNHVRLHTGEKPYSCNVCDKKFAEKKNLDKHVRLHTGEKPYSCNICKKKFSAKSNLDRHVRLHTGEKPYFCNVCDKKFSDKSNLDRHVIRLHTGEKPYFS